MIGAAFFVLLLAGVPIFVVLGLCAIVFAISTGNLALLDSFLRQFNQGMNNYGLLAVPVFILVGELMNAGGITRRLVALANVFLGTLRGGLAYVNLAANMMMAAIVGSAVAQIAVMSRVMVEEMSENGYPRDQAAAITCAGGLLGAIVPPSMPFVVFAVLAQISVGNMFLSGIVPGLMIGFAYLAILVVQARRHKFPRSQDQSQGSPRLSSIAIVLRGVPALMIPVVIVGSILGGYATPTESGGLAALIAFVIGTLVHREISIAKLSQVLVRTVCGSAIALALIGAASAFGWVIIYERIPQRIAEFLVTLTSDPTLFLALVVLAMLVVGMVLDGIAALILVVPILLPIATMNYGIPATQFGAIVVLTLVLGLLTPPVGAGVYIAAAVGGVPPGRLFRTILPYVFAVMSVLVILVLAPSLIDFWIK